MPTAPTKAPAKKAAPARPARQPVLVETIGADDVGGGVGQIKCLVLAEPDAGKTRWASAFPRPLYLACEPTVGSSIASRRIPYEEGLTAPRVVRIHKADRPSDAMLDTLDMLSEVPRKKAPGGLARYQTAVLDTADGLARLLKDEWAQRENAAMFTGRDAWGFLEAKFSLIMTRLLNLDMNVVILCHLKDKTIEEVAGDQILRKTIYEPLLQGASKDNIYNDFDLIGLMKNELVGDQFHRGISFDPTPTYPFLKDHYALDAPGDKRLGKRFWPITLHDGTKGEGSPEEFVEINFGALQAAMIDGLEGLEDGGIVEEVPEAGLPSAEGVMAPTVGGPVAGATDVPAAPAAPPAKKAAPAAKAAPAKVPAKTVAPAPGGGATPAPPTAAPAAAGPSASAETPTPAAPAGITVESTPAEADASDPAAAPTATTESAEAGAAPSTSDVAPEGVDPDGAAGDGAAAGDEAPPVETAADPETAAVSAEEPATDVATAEEALASVQETLGGEVVGEVPTVDYTQQEGHCPICGKSMANEQVDLVQVSRLKHRTLVLPGGRAFYDTGGCCYEDYQSLNKQKETKTGLYAE